jgi:hypothetical protein
MRIISMNHENKYKDKHIVKRLIPVGAVVCVIAAALIIVPGLFEKNIIPDSGPVQSIIKSGANIPAISSLRGLETSNFTYDSGSDGEADSMIDTSGGYAAINGMFYFFNNPDLDSSIAVIHVISTKGLGPDSDSIFNSPRQSSVAEVLYSVGDPIPEKISIMQDLAGGCTGSELSNLVRADGIYVLELNRNINPEYKVDEYYIPTGDLEGLFEVDNKGLIQSHSNSPELEKYDGKSLETLWGDIMYLYERPWLRSLLVIEMKLGVDYNYTTIARGTPIDVNKSYQGEFGECQLYTVDIADTYFGNEEKQILLELDSSSPELEIGTEYIFGCHYYEEMGHYYIGDVRGAVKIGADGKLSPPTSQSEWEDLKRRNYFLFAIGDTMDEFIKKIDEIREYYNL